jgi:MFS family permease
VSTFGDGIALVALILRLQENGAQPYEVALLMGAGGLPFILLARPVGRLVDSCNSRRLLIGGGLAQTGATIPLIFLHSGPAILLLVAALGAATAVTTATWSALVPRIVGDAHLVQAISAQQSLNSLAMVAAPAFGGLLVGLFGTGVPLAIDAVSYGVLAFAAVLIRTRRVPTATPAVDEPSQARGGLALLREDRVLAPLFTGVAFVVLLVGMVDVVLVYLVRETLHAGGVWYGVTEASWMAGMVAGALGASRVRVEQRQVRATLAGVTLTCAGVAGFAIAPTVGILLALSVVGGIGNGYAGACLSTLLMTRTPDSARGRVSAAANAVLGGAQGASLLLGGAVAAVLAPRAMYAVAGLLGLAAAVAIAVTTAARSSRARSRVDDSTGRRPTARVA